MSIQTSEHAEIERLRDLTQRLKLEAQIHAQEARTANATIAEIYAAVTQHTGEPGNWHGAKPVIAELERLRAEVAALRKDAERYRWLRNVAQFEDWEFIGSQASDNMDAAIDVAMREQAMQELVDQAQELDMGYGERK